MIVVKSIPLKIRLCGSKRVNAWFRQSISTIELCQMEPVRSVGCLSYSGLATESTSLDARSVP
jgi:hypothetical protein